MVRLPTALPAAVLLAACCATIQPAKAFINPLRPPSPATAAAVGALRRHRPTPTRMMATGGGGGSPPASIFIVTGSTDGIGQHTAQNLALSPGYKVFCHGRNPSKVKATVDALGVPQFPGSGDVEGFVADLSSLKDVRRLAQEMNDRWVFEVFWGIWDGVWGSGSVAWVLRVFW